MRFVWLLSLFFSSLSFAQVNDSFDDGDFTANPAWSGDTAEWQVVGGQLNTNGPAVTGTVLHLSTPSTVAANAQWEFFANPKAATSSGNYMDVFLTSDSANLESASNGYFVRIGGTPDEVSLFLRQNGTSTKIIDGTDVFINSTSDNPTKVRVTRSSTYDWVLEADSTGTGTNYLVQGTVTDASVTTSSFFGVLVKYSSANAQKYFFDDFTTVVFPDTLAPLVTEVTGVSSTRLDVYFNEVVDQATAESISNYIVNNDIGAPSSATIDVTDNALVHLDFSTAFADGVENVITVSNIKDTAGNAMAAQSLPFTYVSPPAYREVIFNEIFADPSPRVDLPEREFVELYNRSNRPFDLSGWKFSDGTSFVTLEASILNPGQYLILCLMGDTALFSPYGRVLGLGNFPTLNNSGDNLTLTDNLNTLIDNVSYTDAWYNDDEKAKGGWTLELVNPFSPCSGANNWTSSQNPTGGTPGMQNSVYNDTPDNRPPGIAAVNVISETLIEAVFTEIMDSVLLVDAAYTIKNIAVTGIQPVAPLYKSVLLTPGQRLLPNYLYTLAITGATDCAGNALDNPTAEFVLPEQGHPDDIIINEVLFNPHTGGSDFVEIYNNSSKFINLSGWKLANMDKDTVASEKIITDGFLLIRPGEYMALTKDSSNIKEEYPLSLAGSFIQMSSLPSYNNDSGTVILITNMKEISDAFSYTEEMHFALLNDVKGVSLERIDFNRPSGDAGNWHSAAESAGFATPGYKNSQAVSEDAADEEEVSLFPQLFSPDNDGYNDVLNIAYKFDNTGYVANITIFDISGRFVKHLVKNELLGAEGHFTWDGLNEQREKARVGIYIIYFEAFNLSGRVRKYRKSCVVGSKI